VHSPFSLPHSPTQQARARGRPMSHVHDTQHAKAPHACCIAPTSHTTHISARTRYRPSGQHNGTRARQARSHARPSSRALTVTQRAIAHVRYLALERRERPCRSRPTSSHSTRLATPTEVHPVVPCPRRSRVQLKAHSFSWTVVLYTRAPAARSELRGAWRMANFVGSFFRFCKTCWSAAKSPG